MRLLVTGTDGYLGCLLAPVLEGAGHDVLGVDTGYYRTGWLYNGVPSSPRTLHRDIRRLRPVDLEGIDAVVHLAELSNDPLGELIGEVTDDINHRGSVHLANLARDAGAQRFVYMSSCSVYGARDDMVDETTTPAPRTAYAHCKAMVERDVGAMAGDGFSPTFLRNATTFGASPRMRFDIVLNNLAGLAWTERTIAMTSDGSPWRPLVHGLDIATAVTMVLAAPREQVHNEILNVGSNGGNHQVRDIAETVADVFHGCELRFGESAGDDRSYRVSFDKIAHVLPGFACDWDATAGAKQLHAVFEAVELDRATFTSPDHTRLARIEQLIRTGQLDADLYWTHP